MLTWDEGDDSSDEVFDGVEVIKICRRRAGLPGFRFFHPKWTGLIRAMGQAGADVYYHNCGECVTGQIALWCRGNGKGFVFSSANDTDCDPDLPELRSVRDRWLYRYGLQKADARIVQTERQQQSLREQFGLDSIVIPMPCPDLLERPFDHGIPPATPRVLWMARVCRQKRPDRLLELAEMCPDWQFDLAGPVSEEAYSQAIMERAKGLRNVIMHGAVPRDQVRRFYERASVFCSTSDYEGFPNTFLEAWSLGLPMISTFDPDGLIAQRRLGVVVQNMAGMKTAIDFLLKAPGQYRQMSQNARRYYLENHTLEAVMPQFERVLCEVAERVGTSRK